ncbi:MAG: pyridoxamine 5'-phosphate oxidase family protein [Acidimicrobiales bacterium]
MATWGAFADADPELASNALTLLTQFGPGLGFLATVRADGGPRLHPICPVVADGQLWAFIIEASPKCADLRRDGRFALHAFPPEAVDDELAITGTAAEVTEAAPGDELWRRLQAATEAHVGVDGEVLFRLELESVMVATYASRGAFPPAYRTWRPPA